MTSGVVVVGSLNADLVVRVERFPSPGQTVSGLDFDVFPGGKGANQACAAARLGARVEMIGAVGDDAYGALLAKSLQDAGADVSGVRRRATISTGVALITVDATGQNEIVIVAGANGRLAPEDLAQESHRFAAAPVLLLQLEVPLATVEAAIRLGRGSGGRVILDPAPALLDAARLLPLVDYVTPNESELAILAGSDQTSRSVDEAATQARRLVSLGARRVVAKLGARGALLVTREREVLWPPLQVTPVDTTAAGDVWNGAFAAGLAEGRSEDEAGVFANAAAALSATRRGAQPSMPTRDELQEWRRTSGEPRGT